MTASWSGVLNTVDISNFSSQAIRNSLARGESISFRNDHTSNAVYKQRILSLTHTLKQRTLPTLRGRSVSGLRVLNTTPSISSLGLPRICRPRAAPRTALALYECRCKYCALWTSNAISLVIRDSKAPEITAPTEEEGVVGRDSTGFSNQ